MSLAGKEAGGFLKSVSTKLLQKTGNKILDELVSVAFTAALADFGLAGLAGNDNSAQFAAIEQKLDKISKQVDSLDDDVKDLALIERIDGVNGAVANIHSLLRDMFVTMKQYTKTRGRSVTKADINDLRRRIKDRDPFAEAEKIFTAMCVKDSILKQEWLAMLRSEKKAIPDPLDAYIAIKKFSLGYQKQLAHAAHLYRFVVETWWADPSAPAQGLSNEDKEERPEMYKVKQLDAMMTKWDDLLEKGSSPIVDRLIVRMAEAFLGQEEGGLQVFWDRSNGWSLGFYNPQRYPLDGAFRRGEYYVYLHKPRCSNKEHFDDAPFLFYNMDDKTYSIRFKWEGGASGWKDIGPTSIVNNEIRLGTPNYPMERYQIKYNQNYTTAQPLLLRMIRNPSDSDMPGSNIWFYLHLAGPTPTAGFFTRGTTDEGVAKNSTEYLKQFKLQATADGNFDVRISRDCEGQYDTEFAFRLAE